jgi:hypothetical protein
MFSMNAIAFETDEVTPDHFRQDPRISLVVQRMLFGAQSSCKLCATAFTESLVVAILPHLSADCLDMLRPRRNNRFTQTSWFPHGQLFS